MRHNFPYGRLGAIALLCGQLGGQLAAADPSVDMALKLQPVQKADVDFDVPDDPAKCELKGHSAGKVSGWHVFSPTQQLLRRFLDTNGDGNVDMWCYYKNGVEVYRDVDGDFNGKAEQFRWLGTAGIRWGMDEDEDGKIDAWRVISPEEVTAEVVAAIKTQDTSRFERLLISSAELKQLGVSDEQREDITERLNAARKQFATLSRTQRKLDKDADWIHFGGSQPGVIPAGTKGNAKDIYVYDNVSAVVAQADGKHAQVAVGTLVQVGKTWRLIDVPSALDESQLARGGYFFQEMLSNDLANAQAQAGAISPQMQKMIASLTDIDKQIAAATTTAAKAKLNDQRAKLLLDIVKAAPNREDRDIWIQQFADTVGSAVQQGVFPDGVSYLKRLSETVLKADETDHVAHVDFVILSAEYERKMATASDETIGKVHDQWLKELAEFVRKHPKADDTPEALLQLGFHQEFAGDQDKAREYYQTIVRDFPDARVHAKAAGAVRRLQSVGKTLTLSGTDADGRTRSLSDLKGKVVLVHYWASWDQISRQDLTLIRKLQAKYGRSFSPLGINCDTTIEPLKQTRLSWPQIHEAGGLDGELANYLGIMSLPSMLLIGKDGRVVNNGIHGTELEAELEKLLK